jgi:hypothetical protein
MIKEGLNAAVLISELLITALWIVILWLKVGNVSLEQTYEKKRGKLELLRRSQKQEGKQKKRPKQEGTAQTMESFPRIEEKEHAPLIRLQIPLSTSTPSTNYTPRTPSEKSNMAASSPFTTPQVYIRHPFPLPGTGGIRLFDGVNITDWLDAFEDICTEYNTTDEEKRTKIPRYCTGNVGDAVKLMKEWHKEGYNYVVFRKALLKEYKRYDRQQLTYTREFLEEYKHRTRKTGDDITGYCRQFRTVALTLIGKGTLTPYEAGIWFLQGLPKELRNKVMRKHKVTVDDPETVDFKAFVNWVGENAETEESIRELDKEDAKGVERKQDLKELVENVGAPVVVTKEQKKAVPMTDPIEAITQGFKQLSIDLVSAMNKTQGGSQGGF